MITAVGSAWYGSPARGAPRRVLGRIGFSVALPGLDAAYQQLLVTLAQVRRAVADVATSRKRLELQIGQLEHELGEQRSRAATEAGPGGLAEACQTGQHAPQRRLAELRRQYAGIQAREERVSAASMRLQAKVDAFRTAKKTIETAYKEVGAAAEAGLAEAAGGADETDPRSCSRITVRRGSDRRERHQTAGWQTRRIHGLSESRPPGRYRPHPWRP